MRYIKGMILAWLTCDSCNRQFVGQIPNDPAKDTPIDLCKRCS